MEHDENKKIADEKEKEKELKAIKKQIADEKKRRDKELRTLIYAKTESHTEKDLENRQNQIRDIIGKITSISELKQLVSKLRQPYSPHFGYTKDYYKEIFRLNCWPDEDHKKYRKRREVAVWTCRLIYDRFSKEVFSELKLLNPFVGYLVRRDKFFQYLNQEGQVLLDQYIDECIQMMKNFNDWGKFEKEYCRKYSLYYQERLF